MKTKNVFAGLTVVFSLFACSSKDSQASAKIERIEMPSGLTVGVQYFSRSGNTKKVADAIAGALGIDAVSITDAGEFNNKVDILFFGAATYGNDVDKHVKNYITHLNPQFVRKVVIFSTAGADSAYPFLKKLFDEQGISVEDRTFFCRGHILFENIGHPDTADLENAVMFTKSIMAGY
jgi:flavodoxin